MSEQRRLKSKVKTKKHNKKKGEGGIKKNKKKKQTNKKKTEQKNTSGITNCVLSNRLPEKLHRNLSGTNSSRRYTVLLIVTVSFARSKKSENEPKNRKNIMKKANSRKMEE
jgi:hypothetical protein